MKMVRINIIPVKYLTDQHLNAEKTEILMLCKYIIKYPYLDGSEPSKYKLDKGHMKFFKDKVIYLKNRYDTILEELSKRGYNLDYHFPTLKNFLNENLNDWQPCIQDYCIIIPRIMQKIELKPNWYKYYKKDFNLNDYFISLYNLIK